jgi:hypothetical protein
MDHGYFPCSYPTVGAPTLLHDLDLIEPSIPFGSHMSASSGLELFGSDQLEQTLAVLFDTDLSPFSKPAVQPHASSAPQIPASPLLSFVPVGGAVAPASIDAPGFATVPATSPTQCDLSTSASTPDVPATKVRALSLRSSVRS